MKETTYKCNLCALDQQITVGILLDARYTPGANMGGGFVTPQGPARILITSDLRAAEFHLCHPCYQGLCLALERWQTKAVNGDCDQGMAQRPQAVRPVKEDDVLPQPQPREVLGVETFVQPPSAIGPHLRKP